MSSRACLPQAGAAEGSWLDLNVGTIMVNITRYSLKASTVSITQFLGNLVFFFYLSSAGSG